MLIRVMELYSGAGYSEEWVTVLVCMGGYLAPENSYAFSAHFCVFVFWLTYVTA